MLEHDQVGEKHFICKRTARSWDKFNVNWVRLCIIHNKVENTDREREARGRGNVNKNIEGP